MRFSLIAASLLSVLPVINADDGFVVDDTSLVPYYPYVVHKPDNWDGTGPVMMQLGGTGSRGTPGLIDTLCYWNGMGRRLNEYKQGNLTDASTAAATQFLTVIPIAPNETLTEWRVPELFTIMEKVRTQYGFDDNRMFILGYSMGARDMWKALLHNTTYWTAGVAAAGEPDDTYGSLAPLVDIPIRHYQGAQDYVSLAKDSTKTQTDITGMGGKVIELITVQATHNSMGNVPWDYDLLQWLLAQNKSDRSTAPAVSTAEFSPSQTTAANNSPAGASTKTASSSTAAATSGGASLDGSAKAFHSDTTNSAVAFTKPFSLLASAALAFVLWA